MDRTSKESKVENFQYRKSVRIPKMGFIDDLCDINKCGNPIKEQHEFTTSELNKRKLQVNYDKSARMHVKNKSDKCPENRCEDLKVDKWSVVKEKENENLTLRDKYEGEVSIKSVNHYLYLGNTIESDNLTIKERVSKGQGAVKEILNILEGVYFGDSYCEAFKFLRNSKLISILTYNVEVIHGLTKKDIKSLDEVDLFLARRAMKLSTKST